MSTQKLYDQWSATYDEVENRTRDLEKIACESVLSDIDFDSVVELGSGTGKNTAWLASCAKSVISVDLSVEMQAVARQKVTAANVKFRQSDIRQVWDFVDTKVDLITCSLILEHIEDLDFVFQQASFAINKGGHFYLCELHPFKQYAGSKARFDMDGGEQILDCFQHHVTDYTSAAMQNGFAVRKIDEWFDDDDRHKMPRLISFLFSK